MAGISFSVFRDKILDGSKRQTIRAVRKNPINEGQTLYMWWKQRSPQREKLGEAKCTKTTPITIQETKAILTYPDSGDYEIVHLDKFAIADGFDNWQQLIEFFDEAHGLPFEGVLIEWDSIVRDVEPELTAALNDWSFRTDYRGNDDDGSLQVQVQTC
jgi:hypothetical protein